MKAVRLYAAGDLRVEEIAAAPAPADGEVRLRVERAGICGSDLHNFKTGMWISRSPSVPGHEFVAVVEAAGAGACLAPGTRVVADSRVVCGRCAACLAGESFHCENLGFVGEVNDGGFEPYTTLPAAQLVALPDQGLAADVAVLAEPMAVALHAVARLNPATGVPILVAGAGPIGTLVATALVHRGYGPVMLADRNAARLATAAAASGALPVADLAVLPHVPGYAVDATGSPAAVSALLEVLPGGGRIALVGLFHGAPQVPLNAVVEKGLDVVGCAAFRDELPAALVLLGEVRERVAALTGRPIALDDVPATYAELMAGASDRIKAVIDPFR